MPGAAPAYELYVAIVGVLVGGVAWGVVVVRLVIRGRRVAIWLVAALAFVAVRCCACLCVEFTLQLFNFADGVEFLMVGFAEDAVDKFGRVSDVVGRGQEVGVIPHMVAAVDAHCNGEASP